MQKVDHVVMFDFPSNGIDFLHRSGRTARAGRKGLVSCIVRHRDSDFVYLIENALKNGKSIDNLNAKVASPLRRSIEERQRRKKREDKDKKRKGYQADDPSKKGKRQSLHRGKLGTRSRKRVNKVKKHVPIVYPRV